MVDSEYVNSLLYFLKSVFPAVTELILRITHSSYSSVSSLLSSPYLLFLLVIALHIWQMPHKVDSRPIQLPSIPSMPSTMSYPRTARLPARELPAPVMTGRKKLPPNQTRNLALCP